jgi:putative toxin-antitoxin system antitoxin component (TIGR02293 family)
MAWSPRLEHDAGGGAMEAGRLVTKRILGRSMHGDVAFDRIESGLSAETLARLIDDFGRESILDTIQISQRTHERRRSEGRLTREESDRVFRLVRIYALAADVLGGVAEAREWMAAPASALDDRTPLATTRNDAGARQVEDILLRIEYGVYG